ncbi:endo-1,4-beta-mannanase 1 [Elysia marginata]|uniref:Endo-1,4-beta-mannanase 1 n=1 Tax=Elysia marginata TaxID=1093978 RepID=A0AAV4FFX1_9GAST|nr:endo-1,4-beta-mannanase 1 [Elysia marginata]
MTLVDIFTLVVLCTSVEVIGSRLSVSGNHFMLNGEHVFLSGGNLPWIQYAYDFGNNQWAGVKTSMENEMKLLRDAGGNTLRLWIHIQGESSPQFDLNGYVTATDRDGTFIDDFKDMLDLAQSYDILVIPTLWNAAVPQDFENRLNGLIVNPEKLASYIQVVLNPLVQAVKAHPALAAWDVFNEPEGMLDTEVSDLDQCFDTTALNDSGAGWAGKKYNYQQILRFVNWQVDAIKQEDPEALVTVGVWNAKSSTDNFHLANHYSDDCLIKAGNKSLGVLDFYEFHSYSWKCEFDHLAPFKHQWKDYGISKPILIGEFNQMEGGGWTTNQLFDYVYKDGYAGALSWDLVNNGTDQRAGIAFIKNYTGNGKIDIDI